jgi:cytochrome c-type biogenesis protein CcmH/NrfG
VVVGNTMSRQRERDGALRSYQRALQLDPTYSYAYTVCVCE